MKLSWCNTSMGTQIIPSMHEIWSISSNARYKRSSLEIVDQMQTSKYVSRFEPLLYVPAFTQKDFHYVHTGPPTEGTSTEEFAITKLEYTITLSNTTTFTQEARYKAKTQSPLHKRERHKAKLQSPLHKRDKAQSESTTTITSTQEGWTQTQSKKEITILVITIDHKQHLVITIDHKQIFLTKQDPIDRIRYDTQVWGVWKKTTKKILEKNTRMK